MRLRVFARAPLSTTWRRVMWQLAAAKLGAAECTAKGIQFGEYEAVSGTGQAHVWFDA